ncbi:MAG: TrmB family transcriptional regulator [Bdellovibrionales bacterium]|nr:TrmB family transcriptional regulator [Bdellovibrionales bacterium]
MYAPLLQQLGLSKNEARIYETLLQEGESSVGAIAAKSKVHRRNVYDSIKRLLEKGLVFEVLQRNENVYRPVDPQKLLELVEEKALLLRRAMPELERIYREVPRVEEVYIYRGVEGWKNYLRDIIRVGEDFYSIGAKGAWMDPRVMTGFPEFIKETKRQKIRSYHIFDWEVFEQKHPILNYVGKDFKFFPRGYTAPAAVDTFGDRVNILSNIKLGGFDEDFSFTVIVNAGIADAFRTWFRFMYDFCPDPAEPC